MHNSLRITFPLPTAVWLALWLYYDKSGSAVLSICAAVLHECGHLAVLFWLHDTPQEMRVGVFGATIVRAGTSRLSYPQEILAAAAGPAVNLLLSGLLALLLPTAPALKLSVQVNLSLALFNLLPFRILDGGQMLYAALCCRLLPEDAARVQKRIAAAVWIPLTAIGAFVFRRESISYSLLLSSLFVLLSMVLP